MRIISVEYYTAIKARQANCSERGKDGDEATQNPVWPFFCVPFFSFVGKSLHPPRSSPRTEEQIQAVTN